MNAILIAESQVLFGREYILNLNYTEDIVLLTYQIKDIRNLGNNNSSYSKTITIPGTSENNLFFNGIFDLTVNSTFNPNKRAECRVDVDGIVVFTGYLQLNNIRNVNGRIEYEVTLFSNISDFVTKLGNYTLADLDFSEYNHDYTYSNIVGSWDDFYWKNNTQLPFNFGEGYVYPYVDYGQIEYDNVNGKKLEFFKPQFYLKVIWDKIFEKAGYTYTSNFLNSADFKKLLLINGDMSSFQFDEATIESNRIRVAAPQGQTVNDYTQQELTSFSIPPDITSFVNRNDILMTFPEDTQVPNFNPNGYWSTFSSQYIVPETGLYDIRTRPNLNIRVLATSFAAGSDISSLLIGYESRFSYTIKLIKEDLLGNLTIIDSFTPIFPIIKNDIIQINGDVVELIPNQIDNLNTYLVKDEKIYLIIDIQMRRLINTAASTSPFIFSICNDETSYVQINQKAEIVAQTGANPFDVNGKYFKNNDTKLSDIFADICKIFNLHIIDDYYRPLDLFIEPYNDFYTNTVIDYSEKMDRNEEIILTPTFDLTERTIYLTYSEEKDYYNESYQSSTTDIWGEYEYIVDNDFVDRDSELTIEFKEFAPSPLIKEEDKFLTPIYNRDSSGVKETLSNPKLRLLYYNLPLGCSQWNLQDVNNGVSFGQTKYPYAGHLDNPFTPENDLNPFFCNYYFYSSFVGTNNNLYNKYYYNYFYNKLSEDSLLLTGYFKLTTRDIFNIDFRNIYYIDGSYFILNKIIDYNPVVTNLTKVEFIKLLSNDIKNAQFYAPDVTYSSPGGSGFRVTNGNGINYGSEFIQPISPDSVGAGINNRIKDKGGLIVGSNSQIGAGTNGNIIVGENNKIGGGSSQNMLTGQNNFLAGKTNFVFGKNNEFVSDESFIIGNNVKNAQSGAIIMSLPTINQPDVINASRNEVLSPFGQINNNILIVNGSKDSVRQIGGLSNVMVIQAPRQ